MGRRKSEPLRRAVALRQHGAPTADIHPSSVWELQRLLSGPSACHFGSCEQKGYRMSYNARALLLAPFALVIFSTASLALSKDTPRNFILVVPEALSSLGVDQTNAPAIAQLRREGVSYANSHSGFPHLTTEDGSAPQSDLQIQLLVGAAAHKYSTSFTSTVRGSGLEVSEDLKYLVDVTLPRFKAAARPFLLVYRIAEPKYSPPEPGRARPAYKPAPRAADTALVAIEGALKSLGLYDDTNIIIASEHAYSRILKVSNTSRARVVLPQEETLGILTPGFLAIDVAAALQTEHNVISLFDRDNANAVVDWKSGGHTSQGNAILATDYNYLNPLLTIEAHGAFGSIYLSDRLSREQRHQVARLIMEAMLEQDYLGGVFVNEKRAGQLPGALSLTHVLGPRASGTQPDMVIAFASVSEGCPMPTTCTSVIADTPLPEGEGIPNPFNRAGTWTFMAARGPDFRAGIVDEAPASSADIARTIGELMGLDIAPGGLIRARVLTESLAGPRHRLMPNSRAAAQTSTASMEGLVTRVKLQTLGAARYLDTAVQAHMEPAILAYAPRNQEKWWSRWKRFTIEFSTEDY
jgi:hypothetical protein